MWVILFQEMVKKYTFLMLEEDSMRFKERGNGDFDGLYPPGIYRILAGSRRYTLKASLCFAVFWLFLLAFFPRICTAEGVTLAWDENAEPNVAGYRVYYRIGSSGSRVLSRYNGTDIENGNSPIDLPVYEDNNLDPRFVEMDLNGLDENQDYYFVVTAYSTEGLESAASNEASLVRAVTTNDSPVQDDSPVQNDSLVQNENPVHSGSLAPSTSVESTGLGGGGGGCFISSVCR
jgi:hypothetical protein